MLVPIALALSDVAPISPIEQATTSLGAIAVPVVAVALIMLVIVRRRRR